MASADYNYLFKLLIIGDSGVGKSSLLLRFTDNSFSGSYVATIGVDFKIKTLDIDGVKVKLQIWDTAGQERFRTITATYYRGAHGIIVVYDVNEPASFANVKHWFEEITNNCNKSVAKIIVGNKNDDPSTKQVESQDLQTVAHEFRVPCVETSAKLNLNVDHLFQLITRQILQLTASDPAEQQRQKQHQQAIRVSKVNTGQDGGKKKCC